MNPLKTMEHALSVLKSGGMVLVTDDPDREGEADLVMSAGHASPEAINFMACHGRGLICVAVDSATATRLDLREPRPPGNQPLHGTAFTRSVDLIAGCASGISAADRSRTIRALADPESRPRDFTRPGHVFPLEGKPGGVPERRGHTEAALDLCALAGVPGPGVICEVMDDDGSMCRGERLVRKAREWKLPLISVQDIALYRILREPLAPASPPVPIPRDAGTLWMSTWPIPGLPEHRWPLLLSSAPEIPGPGTRQMQEAPPDTLPLVRVHSECCTGETFGSRRCDCGPQLEQALDLVCTRANAAVIYLRQEGRGLGLAKKLQAYALQDQGLDTWDANTALGHLPDEREYRDAAWILHSLGWPRVHLLSNNPGKTAGLEAWGIHVDRELPLITGQHPANRNYLHTKAVRFGHRLPFAGERKET